MNNIYTDVIVYKDRVGKLIEDKDYKLFRFYPAGYGSYYKSELEIVENPESEVTIANSAQGKVYALAEFGRHNLFADYIHISDKYQIIVDRNGEYYPHIEYQSISRKYSTLESALLGMVVYYKIGNEDIRLNKYIFKLLDMKWN